jgi:hypothetical protein
MKQPLFKKNVAITHERLERIELIVSRLVRRTRKVAQAIITPYPISNAISGEGLVGKSLEGTVLRYLFPCNGKIVKGFIRLDKKPKDGVSIDIKIFNDVTSESKGFTIEKKVLDVSTDLVVKAGDCLEITLTPNGESVVKEVWISMLWVPDSGDVQDFLIEDLEKVIEEFTEEL